MHPNNTPHRPSSRPTRQVRRSINPANRSAGTASRPTSTPHAVKAPSVNNMQQITPARSQHVEPSTQHTVTPPAHSQTKTPQAQATEPTHESFFQHYHESVTEPKAPKKYRRLFAEMKSLAGLVMFFGGAFLFALVLNKFVFQSYQVVGHSMDPTLSENNWLVISKLGKSFNNALGRENIPDRGDIILFEDPRQGQEKVLVKRVIALPGEKVDLVDGELVVYNSENPNGIKPDDLVDNNIPGPTAGSAFTDGPVTVPKNNIFVAGDNRSGSLDSRTGLGTVPEDLIVGTLKLRLFPLSDATFNF